MKKFKLYEVVLTVPVAEDSDNTPNHWNWQQLLAAQVDQRAHKQIQLEECGIIGQMSTPDALYEMQDNKKTCRTKREWIKYFRQWGLNEDQAEAQVSDYITSGGLVEIT